MSLDSAGPAARPKTELDSWRAAIIEASDDSIVGNTLDGLITSWNAAAERMYGYSPEEMIGRDVAELVPPGRSCELRAIVERVRRGERIGHFDTQRVRQDGSLFEVSASVLPIRDDYGAVIGAATLARPRAQRHRVPSGWRVLDGELVRAERLEMLGNIAGGIADDFTNLLAAIINSHGRW
jgi:PAS domain S-box-containing protein